MPSDFINIKYHEDIVKSNLKNIRVPAVSGRVVAIL